MNRYYRATRPFQAFIITHHVPSNTFIGRSQVLDPVYKEVTVLEGDEVHNLVGGDFWITEGKSQELTLAKNTRHIFEKTYGAPSPSTERLNQLVESGTLVSIDDPTKVEAYR